MVLMESICKCLSVKNNQERKNSIMESDEGIDGTAAHFTLSNSFANDLMILGVLRLKKIFLLPEVTDSNFSELQVTTILRHNHSTTTTTATTTSQPQPQLPFPAL